MLTCGTATYKLHTLQPGGLPRAARRRQGAAGPGRPRGGSGDGRPGRACCLTGRVQAGADRRARSLRAGEARDGRDRLVPAERQGDRGRGRDARPRGDRPGACAGGARADRAGRRRARARGPREQPGRLRHRRRLADDAPDRRAVPRLQAAVARDVRARAVASARGAARGRPPHRRDGAAQLAAAPALRRGRADGLRPDAGRGRGDGDDAGCLLRRAARDRLQPRLPA